jgi:hypothetical protein
MIGRLLCWLGNLTGWDWLHRFRIHAVQVGWTSEHLPIWSTLSCNRACTRCHKEKCTAPRSAPVSEGERVATCQRCMRYAQSRESTEAKAIALAFDEGWNIVGIRLLCFGCLQMYSFETSHPAVDTSACAGGK